MDKKAPKPPQFYRVIITAPDGRFGQKVIEGGLDKKTANWEAKRYKELGMTVTVQPVATPTNKQGDEE